MQIECFGDGKQCRRAEPCKHACALRCTSTLEQRAEEVECGPDLRLNKWSTEPELLYSAERRARFWRFRCLEHADRIDGLVATLRIALVALEYHRAQTRPIDVSDEAIEALRAAVGCVDDGMPLDGSNPNPPECDPRA